MKKVNWNKDASQIIEFLGGKENIKDIFHCATRLRFYLKDQSLLEVEHLKAMPIVKGYNKANEENQLIIGTGVVDKVFKAIQQELNGSGNTGSFSTENSKKDRLWKKELSIKSNTLMISKRGLSSFAAIFVPLVPVFIAGGMSLALYSLLQQIHPNSGMGKILDIIGGAILGSLPAFVGYTAAKKWGGNPFLGLAMGLILVAPGLLNSYATSQPILLGFDINTPEADIQQAAKDAYENWLAVNNATEAQFPMKDIVGTYSTLFSGFWKIKLIGYQAQIVPVLLVLAISVNVEKLLRKITPDVLAIIVVPLVTVILTTWLAFWAIGPLGQIIGQGFAKGITAIFKYTNYTGIGFGGMLFAGFYPLLVITGLHQGFLPIEAQLLMDSKLQFGHSFSFITPVACVSNIAQGTACLMLIFFIKSKQEKSKAISGSFGANLGITEPAMFGVNLQLKPLLVGSIIGSAIGGYWLGMTHTVANSLGSASWIGLVQFDWTTEFVQKYFADNNIHATFSSLAPGVNVTIAMLISMAATATASYFLLKSKWGKSSLEQYKNQIVESKSI
ncbi:PTS transporter subunit EIIC [Mesoplasma seiffertii]|uniref:PTS transporter subunit EIIC n=1 Tax=Mesoplasma seiffertii TaxID=28224 RepID=UPI000479787D|nr:PTS transporter subunit EIIC [Mesoplasma seiffertii]